MRTFVRTVGDTDEIRHTGCPCGTEIGVRVTDHQNFLRRRAMRCDAVQQPVRIRFAAMTAVGPDHRIKQLQNAKLLQTVARRLLTVIRQKGDPEPGRGQAVKGCCNITLWHRIAMHQLARKPSHLNLIGLVLGKRRHVGWQQRLPNRPDVAKGSRRADTERVDMTRRIINTDGIEKSDARQPAGGRVRLQSQRVVGERLHHREPSSNKIEDHTVLVEHKRAYHFITPGLAGSSGPPNQAPRGFTRSRFTDSTTG